jgi:hypothetical protein
MRYKGIAYPIVKHPQGFFHNAASDMSQVKSDMAAIILTEPGERIFVPHFGCGLSKINLNAPAEITIAEVRKKVATALKKWESRVQVHDIVVDFGESDDKLIIKINVLFIDPFNISNVESLIVYKSLGGMNGRSMPF